MVDFATLFQVDIFTSRFLNICTVYCNGSIKPPRAYLSEKRCLRVGAYSRGGLIKFRGPQVYRTQYLLMSFFNINYFDLNVNRDGVKEEKVGQLFSSDISTYDQINS